ncbi:diacylglycerol kinase [Nitratidesulfovibrio sp. SRB-5]|uniref:diacylglycerol kinase n=1 Tax=Nitratidesulfovibrio sp. SRB-5 TaxID=2872636 RepID=UPI001025C505|nr:diacylglycerol kinase [Nitratidesulfovibrio sp. SRB-5]MBZ2172750.1 diacylglycerol kinase [Nitratidesulfovibrio sp. SRB-5]RXF76494.1 diacylglycerol kinase [Desulfovibrio sp. DS-1]
MKVLRDIAYRRVICAARYSLAGFRAAVAKEESFRMELLGLAVLLLVLLFIPWALWKKILMVACYLLVLLTELLNSAIEDVCDLVSPGHSEYVRTAKDKGSMAVLLALVFNLLVFVVLLLV